MAARPSHFWVATTATPAGACVSPHGEVDLATAPKLQAAFDILGARYATITLDLSDVGFMDSAGLSAIFLFSRAAQRAGVALIVTGVHGEVATAMQVTGLDEVLQIEPVD